MDKQKAVRKEKEGAFVDLLNQEMQELQDGIEQEQIELKPCPFCGGESEYVEYYLYGRVKAHLVYCTKCDVTQKNYKSKQGAIRAWNRRVNNG